MTSVPERDWKVFTRIHPGALDRFCKRVLEEVDAIAKDESKSFHERYLAIYKLIQREDKEMANVFNDYRRSTAFWQIGIMYTHGLLTEEEFMQFTPETRNAIAALQEVRGEE